MKKIIFSALVFVAVVTLNSCREKAETTEETTAVEETVETTIVEEAKEMALETTLEVADTTETVVEKIEE